MASTKNRMIPSQMTINELVEKRTQKRLSRENGD